MRSIWDTIEGRRFKDIKSGPGPNMSFSHHSMVNCHLELLWNLQGGAGLTVPYHIIVAHDLQAEMTSHENMIYKWGKWVALFVWISVLFRIYVVIFFFNQTIQPYSEWNKTTRGWTGVLIRETQGCCKLMLSLGIHHWAVDEAIDS